MTKRYDEYEDSGIEWLGEIPSHWKMKRLKDFNKIIAGQSVPSDKVFSERKKGSLPFIQGSAEFDSKTFNPVFKNFTNDPQKTIEKNCLLMSVRAPVGELNISNEKIAIGRGISGVIGKTNFNKYLFEQMKPVFYSNEKGTTFKAITNGDLKNIISLYPDENEQDLIADYLDNKTAKIDSAVAELEKQKSLLIELKKSTIHQAVTKGLDLTVPMKDSGVEWIGQIPSHWSFSKMNNLFTFEKGKNAQMYNKDYILDEKRSGKYPVYSGQTENFGVMGKINTYEYDFNSVIFVTTVGAKFMTPSYLSGKFSLSQNCLLIKNRKNIENKYYFYFLMAQFIEERKKIACIIQPSLRIEDLKKLTNLRPKKSEQIKIANYLDSFVNKTNTAIRELDNQIAKMKEYKKTLINDVVTGKIKVV